MPGKRSAARLYLSVRRFTNQRARARTNGCTFQHALAGNRCGTCAHGITPRFIIPVAKA